MIKKRVKKRAVSPVVATVLLIAMVIAIALILFLWFRNMVKEDGKKFDNENIKITCGKVTIKSEYSPSSGKITVINNGNVPLYGINVRIYTEDSDSEETFTPSTDSTNLKTGINPGKAYSREIAGDNVKRIIVYPILIGNTKEGTRSHVCRDNGVEIIV